jgi:hypothetical protein
MPVQRISAEDTAREIRANRHHAAEGLRHIAPVPGPLGDDLLLRAIGSAMLGHVFPQHDGRTQDFLVQAERLGLVKINGLGTTVSNVSLSVTELGTLYWISRGGDFAKFIYNCPEIADIAYQEPEASELPAP